MMTLQFLKREGLPTLAYRKIKGQEGQPIVVFLGGFRSDMEGTKAAYLEAQCQAAGIGYVRFDYRGHGQSEGKFEEACIGDWLTDSLDIIESCTSGGVVLVGSSMGGWLSLLVALKKPKYVQAIIGLAAAPDFTTWMERDMSQEQQQEMADQGFIDLPNDYSDEPYIITRKLIEEGRNHCLLDGDIDLDIPIRLIQGKKDADVPWKVAERIKDFLVSKDVQTIYIEEADHRLSKPEELEIIKYTLLNLFA